MQRKCKEETIHELEKLVQHYEELWSAVVSVKKVQVVKVTVQADSVEVKQKNRTLQTQRLTEFLQVSVAKKHRPKKTTVQCKHRQCH